MAAIKQDASPVSTSYSTEERYFATRYKQGTRTVFAFQLSPAEITALVKRPNPEASNPGNRRIRARHAQGFAQYFLDNEVWVVPGIILRAPSIFTFEENSELSPPGASFGFVSFPRRNQGDIHILDGQHRILGFFIAEEMIDAGLDKARTARATAKRTEGDKSAAYKQAEKEIARLERVRDRFHTERISVEIQVTDDMVAYRQMFYDIADNALGITASVKARFDTRKVINRALPAVLEHPLLADRTDLEVDRIRKTSPFFLTARNVVEIVRVANVGIDGRVGRRLEQELKEGGVAQAATEFLDSAVEAFPQLQAVSDATLTPDALRASSLLGSPLFLRILAGARYELLSEHGFTKSMVLEFFKTLAPHVGAPTHENDIWVRHTDEGVFFPGRFGPNGARQSATSLVKTLVTWAVMKPDFLAAEPEPAPAPGPEVNEDGDVAIDFSDLHDVKALDVEERNAIEDIAAEAKAKARRATKSR